MSLICHKRGLVGRQQSSGRLELISSQHTHTHTHTGVQRQRHGVCHYSCHHRFTTYSIPPARLPHRLRHTLHYYYAASSLCVASCGLPLQTEWRGLSVCWSRRSAVQTAELIEIPFAERWGRTCAGPRNQVLDRVHIGATWQIRIPVRGGSATCPTSLTTCFTLLQY